MIRAVLFDAVGTLLHPAERVGETYARFARREGLEVEAATLERCFRESFGASPPLTFPAAAASDLRLRERDWWRAVVTGTFRRAGMGAEPALDRVFRGVFEDFATAKAWRLFADARPAIARLRELGLRLGVVSNFDARLHGLLADFALADSFDAVVISSECGFAKPDPRIFAAALRAMRTDPAAALHVGDSEELDVAAARRAGLRAVRIDRGSPAGESSIPSLLELAEWTKR